MTTSRHHVQGRQFHVLVIDDEADALDLARERLESEGHRVTTSRSANGIEAVIDALCPDLVLLDVMMPNLGAQELTSILALHSESSPRVILHSSIPLRALRHAVDPTHALGVIRKTNDDIEFFFAFNGLIDRLPEPSQRSPAADVPAVSGTHRIADEKSSTELDSMEHWFSRTSPGRG